LIDKILADEERELEAIISNLDIEDREMEDALVDEESTVPTHIASQQTESSHEECLGCGLDEFVNLGNEHFCFNCGWTYTL